MRGKVTLVLALAWLPAFAQITDYLGPQILTRGANFGSRPGSNAGFSFYAGVYGSYDTGLVPASVDAQGRLIRQDSLVGIGVNFGAYGKKTWRKTALGLNYYGNFRHYPKNAYWDGSDHTLGMSLSHRINRRMNVQSSLYAGIQSFNFVPGSTDAIALDPATSPYFGVYDNRTYFLSGSAGFTYQKSLRLSFVAGGLGFLVRRQSSAVVGINGYSATGGVRYRLTRRRTLLVDYSNSHYDYPRGYGETNVNTYLGGIAQVFGRRWQGTLSAGASQISTVGLQQVAADPITAALFGVPVTIETFSRSLYVGSGQASLSGNFKRSNFGLYYMMMPSAGNGVYLTSKSSNAGMYYNYVGIRKLSLSAFAAYVRFGSIGQSQLGTFSFASGGAGLSYKLLGSLNASANYDVRNIQIDQTNGFARTSYSIRFALNFTSGTIPLSFR